MSIESAIIEFMTTSIYSADEFLNKTLLDTRSYIGANQMYVQRIDQSNSNKLIQSALVSLELASGSIFSATEQNSGISRQQKENAATLSIHLRSAVNSLLFSVNNLQGLTKDQVIDMLAPEVTHASDAISRTLAD